MISPAFAQGGAASSAPQIVNFLPIIAIFAIFYFLVFRPQQQQGAAQDSMRKNLKRNDDVVTAGGLHGKVVALSENIVTLEIAPKVQVRVDRTHIATLLSKDAPSAETARE